MKHPNEVGHITYVSAMRTIIRNENIAPFDVDGTLIIHGTIDDLSKYSTVAVVDPVNPLQTITVGVNEPMVRLMREEAHRGATIFVWSRGGYEWADNVIVALGLEAVVDYVMTKPKAYFDDTSVDKWLNDRVFIGPETVYKNKTINTKETK